MCRTSQANWKAALGNLLCRPGRAQDVGDLLQASRDGFLQWSGGENRIYVGRPVHIGAKLEERSHGARLRLASGI